MSSKMRKPLSLVLVFVMALSIVGVAPKTAKAAINEGKYFDVDVEVEAPYEQYYSDFSTGVNLDDPSISDEEAGITRNDLKDDFGLGLSTDGSEGFTILRALAKVIRNTILYRKGITPSEATDDQLKAANEEIPKYINISGGFLYGLSNDGTNFNTGTIKNSTSADLNGSWVVLVRKYGEKKFTRTSGIETQKLDNFDEVEIKWVHYADTNYSTSYGYFDADSYYVQEGKTLSLTVNQDIVSFDEAFNDVKSTSTVADANIEIVGTNKTLTTDANGKVSIPKDLKEGNYTLVATKDVVEGDSTYSTITRAEASLRVISAPSKTTGVKAKVSGKSKKKTIKVSWSGPKNDIYISYQVYVSKKKNSGYKKVTKTNVYGKTNYSFKKTKGTYYVKVRKVKTIDTGSEGSDGEMKINGAFSSPVKVKVK